jgi:hypothetical protein
MDVTFLITLMFSFSLLLCSERASQHGVVQNGQPVNCFLLSISFDTGVPVPLSLSVVLISLEESVSMMNNIDVEKLTKCEHLSLWIHRSLKFESCQC